MTSLTITTARVVVTIMLVNRMLSENAKPQKPNAEAISEALAENNEN